MKSLILFSLLLTQSLDHVACGTRETTDRDTPVSLSPCNNELWGRTYGAMSRFGDHKTINWNGDPYIRKNLTHRCVTGIKATIREFAPQPDGDIKLWLTLHESNFQYRGPMPPGFTPVVREEFYPPGTDPRKWFIAEVVCAAPVTDANNNGARTACDGYTNNVLRFVPPRVFYNNGEVMNKGDVVFITGERIYDTGLVEVRNSNPKRYEIGHKQMEIHPVTEIRKKTGQ